MKLENLPEIEIGDKERLASALTLQKVYPQISLGRVEQNRLEHFLQAGVQCFLERNNRTRAIIKSFSSVSEDEEKNWEAAEMLEEISRAFETHTGYNFRFRIADPAKSEKSTYDVLLKSVENKITELKEKERTRGEEIETTRYPRVAEIFVDKIYGGSVNYSDWLLKAKNVKTEKDFEKFVLDSREFAAKKLSRAHSEDLEKVRKIENMVEDISQQNYETLESLAHYIQQFTSTIPGFEYPENFYGGGNTTEEALKIYLDKILKSVLKNFDKKHQVGDLVRIIEKDLVGEIEKTGWLKVASGEEYGFAYVVATRNNGEAQPLRENFQSEKIENVRNGVVSYLKKKFGGSKEEVEKFLSKFINRNGWRKMKKGLTRQTKSDFESFYGKKLSADAPAVDDFLKHMSQTAQKTFESEKTRGVSEVNLGLRLLRSMYEEIKDDKNLPQAIVDKKIVKYAKDFVSRDYFKALVKDLEQRQLITKYHHNETKQIFVVNPKRVIKEIRKSIARGNRSLRKEIDEKGFSHTKKKGQTYVYTPDGKTQTEGKILDPFAIGQSFLEDLLTVAPNFIRNSRQKEALAIAKLMIAGTPVIRRDARAVLSKDNKIYFDMIVEAVQKTGVEQESVGKIREFNLYDNLERRKSTVQSRKFEDKYIEGGNRAVQIALRDLVVSEVIAALQGDKKLRRVWSDFSTVWERFKPQGYDLPNLSLKTGRVLPSEIRIVPIKNVGELQSAYEGTGSCITNDREVTDLYSKDLATILFRVENPQRSIGYVRAYCMEDVKSGEPVLAVDTVEMPHKGFKMHRDYLLAAGLAIVQHGLDNNFHYVLGADARVAHGIRQAFGDQYLERDLRKMGLDSWFGGGFPGFCYKVNSSGSTGKKKSSVLMLNWKRGMKNALA